MANLILERYTGSGFGRIQEKITPDPKGTIGTLFENNFPIFCNFLKLSLFQYLTKLIKTKVNYIL